jgi:uncharacterized protein (DUF433 family)
MAAPPSSLLDREVYDERLAADVLGVAQPTLHYWLEGGNQRGKAHEPVLRAAPTGSKVVTWGEFVEARYLREYRRTLGASLSNIRAFIQHLRRELDVSYPLARARPWVGPGRHLFIVAQNEAGLPSDLWAAIEPVIEPHTGVAMLLPPAEAFLERVEFDDDQTGIVVRLRPDGQESPVVIDPDVRFGSPAVHGIPTDAIDEQVRAGDSIESIVQDFSLELDDVIAALRYESLRRQPVG